MRFSDEKYAVSTEGGQQISISLGVSGPSVGTGIKLSQLFRLYRNRPFSRVFRNIAEDMLNVERLGGLYDKLRSSIREHEKATYPKIDVTPKFMEHKESEQGRPAELWRAQPRRLRRDLETARHYRVGVRCKGGYFRRLSGVSSSAVVSAAAQLFHLLERARPVFAHQARQCSVGEQPPAGLATRAIVRLVVRVRNPSDWGAASRARFSVPSVDRHAFVKGGHFLGEALSASGG